MRDSKDDKVSWYLWASPARLPPYQECWMDGDILRYGRKPPSADKDFQRFMAKVLKA